MSGLKILPTILIMVPATVLLSAQTSLGEPAADACRASPGANAPRGTHWYYRVRAKQHCWYLGQAGAHVSVPATVSDVAAQTRRADAADTSVADASDVAPAPVAAAPAATSTSSAPAAAVADAPPAPPRAAAEVPPAPAEDSQSAGFATRWPENLPNAEDVSQPDAASPQDPAVSSSYAEGHDVAEAAGQMPAKWPLAEKPQVSTGETVLRYFSIAGLVAIPLLLVVGWAAKFERRRRWPFARDLRQATDGELPSRRPAEAAEPAEVADPAEVAAAMQAVVQRRVQEKRSVQEGRQAADRRARTLTDPADNLKISLSELMRDLRRAAASAPDQPAGQRQTRAEDYAPLQAAE